MAELVGEARIGNRGFRFWNNGLITDINGNPLGTFTEHIDADGNQDGTWDLIDNNGQLYGNLNATATNMSFPDGSSVPYTWAANNDFSGVDDRPPEQTPDTIPSQMPDTASDFSANTIAGTLTVDDHIYQVTYSGTGDRMQLWENGQEVGYATPGQDGSFNVYTLGDVPVATIYSNGTVVSASGAPISGSASYTAYDSTMPQEADSAAGLGTITVYDGQGGSFDVTMRDGGLWGFGGEFMGTYETTGPNEYALYNPQHESYGIYNSSTGTLAGSDGVNYTGHFTASGNALPDVSQVEGPWSTSQSQSTSYSGLGQQYQSNIDQWMSDLSASMTPEAFQSLISGAYNKAAGQTGAAYQAAQSYLPEIYQQTLTPALQAGVNTLARKNMLSSTVGEGTMAGAANLAYQSVLPYQAQLAGQEAGALSTLAGQEAQYQTAYPATLGGMVGNLGKFSATQSTSRSEGRNPLAPYALVYGTLPYMAAGGTA